MRIHLIEFITIQSHQSPNQSENISAFRQLQNNTHYAYLFWLAFKGDRSAQRLYNEISWQLITPAITRRYNLLVEYGVYVSSIANGSRDAAYCVSTNPLLQRADPQMSV
ncbi:MAG: hypothetical protein IBX69_09820 [Anaerolineales bacterium]|nr:hypothetical protein [Anaerolineales bacterium]